MGSCFTRAPHSCAAALTGWYTANLPIDIKRYVTPDESINLWPSRERAIVWSIWGARDNLQLSAAMKASRANRIQHGTVCLQEQLTDPSGLRYTRLPGSPKATHFTAGGGVLLGQQEVHRSKKLVCTWPFRHHMHCTAAPAGAYERGRSASCLLPSPVTAPTPDCAGIATGC